MNEQRDPKRFPREKADLCKVGLKPFGRTRSLDKQQRDGGRHFNQESSVEVAMLPVCLEGRAS